MVTYGSDINLLQAKTGLSPHTVALAVQLRRMAWLALVVILGAGLVLVLGYFFLRAKGRELTEQKKQLVAAIGAQSKKESLLLTVKGQVAVVARVMASQKPWVEVVATVTRIAGPPHLTSFAVNDKGEISLVVRASSIEEMVTIIDQATREVRQNRIKNPVLNWLQLDKDGGVKASLTFTALF